MYSSTSINFIIKCKMHIILCRFIENKFNSKYYLYTYKYKNNLTILTSVTLMSRRKIIIRFVGFIKCHHAFLSCSMSVKVLFIFIFNLILQNLKARISCIFFYNKAKFKEIIQLMSTISYIYKYNGHWIVENNVG